MKKELAALGLAVSASLLAGVHDVRLDTSPDRVESPLQVNLARVGTLRPRAAHEIAGSNWRLGCEVLDRDYAKFDEYKEHVEPLGIKLVRLQGGWAKCEKAKGAYDFAWLDHIVDTLAAQGVRCAIETSYGNPIYPGGGTVDLAAGFPSTEEGLQGWDNWVRALTRHFRGRVDTWLMWNEPDIPPKDGSARKTPEQIAAFNVRTAKIVKESIPDARIAGLSLASCKSELLEQCLAAMGADVKLFDWIIYHGYAAAPEQSYAEVEKQKAVLAKYNPAARMWQGENGCPSEMATRFALSGVPWSEYSQAKWDMRRMLGDLGHDVESSVFTICDFNHTGREINLKGLLRADENRDVIAVKRAYYAVQNVVSVFDDTVVRVKDSCYEKGFGSKDPTLVTYAYEKDGAKPIFVFWRAGEVERNRKTADLLPDGLGFGVKWQRPGDSFATAPTVFRYTGAPLKEPVWVDLLTGRVYAFPPAKQVCTAGVVRFLDVPVYDSPCLLAEKSALQLQ